MWWRERGGVREEYANEPYIMFNLISHAHILHTLRTGSLWAFTYIFILKNLLSYMYLCRVHVHTGTRGQKGHQIRWGLSCKWP